MVTDKAFLFRDKKKINVVFEEALRTQPWIDDQLSQSTTIGEIHKTSNYSYESTQIAKDGLVLVGDAYAFLDPVFSSGVHLALCSGLSAAKMISKRLLDGAKTILESDFIAYQRQFHASYEPMKRLVHLFYNKKFHFSRFVKKHPEQNFLPIRLSPNLI